MKRLTIKSTASLLAILCLYMAPSYADQLNNDKSITNQTSISGNTVMLASAWYSSFGAFQMLGSYSIPGFTEQSCEQRRATVSSDIKSMFARTNYKDLEVETRCESVPK